MVDQEQEREDRTNLYNRSDLTTKEFNLARSRWLYMRTQKSPTKNDNKDQKL